MDVPEKTVATVTRELQALGVERGAVLEVHTAFRAVRPIENGPLGLIQALRNALGPAGTLVMPSFTGDDQPFDPRTTAASPDLGIVPDLFWRLPDVQRSSHPFAFAAAGPLAAEIVAGPLPIPPHTIDSPVGRVWQHDGQVLLLGVGHDADTLLHLAELQAEVPYRVPKHITVLDDAGQPVRLQYAENDHCCQRFAFADDWLRAHAHQSEAQVGYAQARLARAKHIVAAAVEHLRANPLLFLHPPEAACEECAAARATVPLSS